MKLVGNSPEYFMVKRVIVYPEYTNTSFYHDIGLIELNRPVTFTPYIRAACLPPSNYKVENVKAFVASTWETVAGSTDGKFLKIKLSRVSDR